MYGTSRCGCCCRADCVSQSSERDGGPLRSKRRSLSDRPERRVVLPSAAALVSSRSCLVLRRCFFRDHGDRRNFRCRDGRAPSSFVCASFGATAMVIVVSGKIPPNGIRRVRVSRRGAGSFFCSPLNRHRPPVRRLSHLPPRRDSSGIGPRRRGLTIVAVFFLRTSSSAAIVRAVLAPNRRARRGGRRVPAVLGPS